MTDLIPCPGCGAMSWTTLGATPVGRLDRCDCCGSEQVVPDADAQALAAERDADVAAAGAERAFEVVAGPLSTGPVVRLRHGEQVAALVNAATHAVGTPESVALCLRASGYEIVLSRPARCTCPTDVATGEALRNPTCAIHGDVATVAVSGG